MMTTHPIPVLWKNNIDKHYILKIIDISLRGCAQVMFQNNPITGVLFFIAIFIAAYSNNNPLAAWGCVIGTVLASITGAITHDVKGWRDGLYSYNGCLVGIAIPVFITATPLMWFCLIVGSVVSVIGTVCIADILKTWKVAALTAPFVLTTWVILLASYAFHEIYGSGLPLPELPQHYIPTTPSSYSFSFFIDGTLHGISQVFLFPGILASLFFIAGLAVESVVCACYAVVGSLIATLLAYYLGANAHDISSGLYAFSAVLTSVALGTVFNQPGWRVFIYTISGIIFTVFIQAAMNVLLMPFGIPTLTMPFVISSWLFLVPNKEFMPEHRHS